MLASRKGVRDEELAKAKVCTVPVNTGACDSIFVVMVTFNYTARFMVASVMVASLCSRLPVSGCRTSSRRYSASVTPVHYPLTLLLRKLASRHLLNSRLAVALSTGAVERVFPSTHSFSLLWRATRRLCVRLTRRRMTVSASSKSCANAHTRRPNGRVLHGACTRFSSFCWGYSRKGACRRTWEGRALIGQPSTSPGFCACSVEANQASTNRAWWTSLCYCGYAAQARTPCSVATSPCSPARGHWKTRSVLVPSLQGSI